MSDASGHWSRRPRTSPNESADVARASLREALADIRTFVGYVQSHAPESFATDAGAYGAATTAVLRAASLFENRDFAPFLTSTPAAVRDGLRATRNIAARAGYARMDDRLFRETVVVHLAAQLDVWEAALG